jgi:fumarylpyruvate hydrolase
VASSTDHLKPRDRAFPETPMSYVIPAPRQATVPVAGGGEFPVRRIYCVGRNYAEHAQEMGFSGREPPFFFMKPADAVLPVADGTIGDMAYPPLTKNLHHEIELVVAIGTGGRDIAVEDAARHIWGYAIGLDMTRRDLQGEMKKQGRPWCIGKGFDQSAPIGPIHPIAATGELTRGAITVAVNGQPRQKGDLSELIWSVNETIATLSQAWTLQPGDLVFTGTPAGVAAVVPGDVMEGAIEGLGTLRVAVR